MSDIESLSSDKHPAPPRETSEARQRRIARETRDLEHALASAAAGRVVESAKVKAWIDRIGIDQELSVPYSGR